MNVKCMSVVDSSLMMKTKMKNGKSERKNIYMYIVRSKTGRVDFHIFIFLSITPFPKD